MTPAPLAQLRPGSEFVTLLTHREGTVLEVSRDRARNVVCWIGGAEMPLRPGLLVLPVSQQAVKPRRRFRSGDVPVTYPLHAPTPRGERKIA